MALLAVADALKRILDGAAPVVETETVSLDNAVDRITAGELTARLTQPPFDASAMDGFAVRREDVKKPPAKLKVVGEAAAGHAFEGQVGAGEAVRIFTGAPVPAGADAIVIQENTSFDEDVLEVLDGQPDPKHLRQAGGDFKAGDGVIPAGHILTPRDLSLVAAMGLHEVLVYRKPTIAILATGDELVPPGQSPGPGQIVSSNPVGLAAMINRAGGEARILDIARDEPTSLNAQIKKALDADILVTIGGASVGDHDLVADRLQANGMTLDFWKIAMRPGKPLLFGRLKNLRVLGLPGNPVSSLICARVFLVPLLNALRGTKDQHELHFQAKLNCDLAANGPREHYMRATVTTDASGQYHVAPARSQDSSLLSILAEANALIVRPPNAPPLASGEHVRVIALDF